MMYRLPICLGISLAFGTTSLMAQERLTPEVMWQLGKLSEAKVSPDGKNLIYGVSFANIQENKSNRELFSVPVAGGAAKQLTQTPKSERNACWRPDGKKIGYLYDGQLWEMNPDGSEAQQLSHIDGGISEFLYAPNGKAILYAANVKIDKNLHDKYPDLPKTNAMEYDGLMYRHWDTYEDGEYSHVFLASYENGNVGTGLDIMAGEAYDTPLAPMGSFVEQVAMSPDCKTIAYTCKKMTGTKYALSTNSDIYLYNVDSKQTINITVANKGYDQNPVFSPDGKRLLMKVWQWMAMRRIKTDWQSMM